MEKTTYKYFDLTVLSLMIAITAVLFYSPLGNINIGLISITIAHIPILIITILLGLKPGLINAFAFGLFSLLSALLAPKGLLSPLFINPMISIVPRMMIPVTTFLVYHLLKNKNKTLATTLAVILGNLTNTFFVYFSMYIFAGKKVVELTGKNFATVIAGLVGTSTAIKTVIVAVITVPIILALQKYMESR